MPGGVTSGYVTSQMVFRRSPGEIGVTGSAFGPRASVAVPGPPVKPETRPYSVLTIPTGPPAALDGLSGIYFFRFFRIFAM